jgi:hypothetical protein
MVLGGGGVATCNFANNATFDGFAHMADDFWLHNLQLCQALLGLSLHYESGPIFNPNSTIPICAKIEISTKGFFTLGIKAEIEKKKLFNLPQVTNKC